MVRWMQTCFISATLLGVALAAGCAKGGVAVQPSVQAPQPQPVQAEPVLASLPQAPEPAEAPHLPEFPPDATPVTAREVEDLLARAGGHDYTFTEADGRTLAVRANGDYWSDLGQGFMHKGTRAWDVWDGKVVSGPWAGSIPQKPGLQQEEAIEPRDLSILGFLERMGERGALYRTAAEPDIWQASDQTASLTVGDLPRMYAIFRDETQPVSPWHLRVNVAELPQSFTLEWFDDGRPFQFSGSYVWGRADLPAIPPEFDPPHRQIGLAGVFLGEVDVDDVLAWVNWGFPVRRPLPGGGEWRETEDGTVAVQVQDGRVVFIRLKPIKPKAARLNNHLWIGRDSRADVVKRFGQPADGTAADRMEYRFKGGTLTFFLTPDGTVEAVEASSIPKEANHVGK